MSAPIKKADITPSVSLAISAFNEEEILPRKLENARSLDYPNHLVKIAVISDGSTDKTNEIIHHFAEQSNKITPCISQQHKGKTACLNEFVPNLRGEIILFSDANSFYDKNVIRRIVRPFVDPDIGFVTGSTKYVSPSKDNSEDATGFYSRLERWTKSLETRTGSCVGADGAVFAMRKTFFSALQPEDINDLVIPFHVISQGYRGMLEPSVFCTEEFAGRTAEFKRQVRITNRTLRAIFNHNHLLNPFQYPLFAFKLFSHKIMKFLTPFFLLILLITNGFLAFGDIAFYKVTLVLQVLFYFFSLVGLLRTKKHKSKLIGICGMFLTVNVAYFMGWIEYLIGKRYTSWKPSR
ncbi:MAG: glycosyltransferase [Deltaproteobacteria bacterium]|nr:glycosyltransferase [Deltaproteobacteria bacterium]